MSEEKKETKRDEKEKVTKEKKMNELYTRAVYTHKHTNDDQLSLCLILAAHLLK